MDETRGLPRSQLLLSMAWEGVGLYALAEGQVRRLIDRYTSEIPGPLRSLVVKPNLRDDERQQALAIVLDDHGLAIHYPDLVDLFRHVGKVRNRLAHGSLIYVAAEDDDDVPPADRVPEGLGIVGNRGTGRMSPDELRAFRESAQRLVGLLNVLVMETGQDQAGSIDLPFRGSIPLTSPREPLSYTGRPAGH